MKLKELKNLDQKALEKKLKELKLELMKVNVQIAMGTDPKLSGKIRHIKRTVARIETLLRGKSEDTRQ